VLSHTGFVPYSGSTSYYVIGEVLNNTGGTVEFVKVSVALRNDQGNVVDSDYSYSMITSLSPDMKSPFQVIFIDPPTNYSHYTLTVTWSDGGEGPAVLEVLNQTSRFDSLDAFRVSGEVRNQTEHQATFVQAVVTMYGHTGNVIGVDYSFTDPYDLAPGGTATFDVGVYSWVGKPDTSHYASYALQVVDD
jgi:hypothetical protein